MMYKAKRVYYLIEGFYKKDIQKRKDTYYFSDEKGREEYGK